MYLTISKENLVNCLYFLAYLSSKKTLTKSTQYITVQISHSILKMTLELSDMSLHSWLLLDNPHDTTSPLLIDAKKLMAVINSLPDKDLLTISSSQNHQLLIMSSKSKSKFTMTLPLHDKINQDAPESLHVLHPTTIVNSIELLESIRYTKVLVLKNQTRLYLNAMMMELSDEQLTFVTTDGHRMAISKISVDTGKLNHISVIIPRLPILEFYKFLSKKQAHDVNITFQQNIISFSHKDYLYSIKLLLTDYPDYKSYINQNIEHISIKLPNKPLQESLIRFCSLDASLKDTIVKIVFSQSSMYMTSQSKIQDQLTDEIEIDYKNCDTIELGVNAKYLLEVIKEIKDQYLYLKFYGKDRAFLISKNLTNSDSIFIVSPVRL